VAGSAGFFDENSFYSTAFALARYTANGILDSSFGLNGLVTTDFNSSSHANAVALQGDKIIAAGGPDPYSNSSHDLALARYTTNGALDSSFGVNGKVITDLDASASIQGIDMHEKRLYAVGSLYSFAGDTYGVKDAYKVK